MVVGISFDDGNAISGINNVNHEVDKVGKGFAGLRNEGQDLFDSAAKSLDGFSKKTAIFGAGMTAGITAPITGLGIASLKIGADFESSMSAVSAVTGATGAEFDALKEQARELGATTQFSASEAAQGMEMLGRAGFSTEEVMSSMPGMLDLSASSAVELGAAADIASNILSGFGMEATETGRVADVLAKASADANTDVVGLGEAFKYVGPVAAGLGVSFEDTAAAIGLLGDAGIAGGQAGTVLRSGLLSLASPSKDASKLMKKLGVNVFDAEGNMKDLPSVIGELESGLDGMTSQQKTANLEMLFGKEAVSGFMALIEAGPDELAKFSSELESSEGTAAKMAETMNDNLAGRMKEMMSALEELALVVYDSLEPAFSVMTEKATKVAQWFGKLSQDTQRYILVAAGLAAAIGPVALGISAVAKVASVLMPVIKGLRTVTLMFNAALLANPITWVVAGIVGLVAAGVLLCKNWDTVKLKAGELWEGIKEKWDLLTTATSIMWDAFKTYISEAFDSAKESMSNFFNPLVEFFNTAKEKASELWQAVLDNPLLLVAAGPIGTMVAAGITLYQNWETIKETAIGLWSTITEKWDSLKTTTTEVWESVKTSISTSMETATTAVSDFFSPLLSFLDSAKTKWDDFKSAMSNFSMPKIGMPKFMGGNGVIQMGSHATGLGRVPYDEYPMYAHKDEAILTAEQSNALRSAGMLKGDGVGPTLDLSKSSAPATSSGTPSTSENNNTFHFHISGDNAKGIASEVKREIENFFDSLNRRKPRTTEL